MSFEKIFEVCENRIHAIFLFLNLLELVQQQYFRIKIGEGKNNFLVEWNDEGPATADTFAPVVADPFLN
jgi:segregation and condensation protein A